MWHLEWRETLVVQHQPITNNNLDTYYTISSDTETTHSNKGAINMHQSVEAIK